MFSRIISILKKIQSNGLGWLYNRLILEFRIPETPAGKKLKPFNVFVYKTFSVLTKPFQLILQKNASAQNTLYLFYDFEVCPITFNFCETLGMANAYRKTLNLDYLYIVFVPGSNDGLRKESVDYEQIIHKDSRHWRKYNLLFPLTHLIPACNGFSNCASREEADLIQKRVSPNIYPNGYSVMFPLDFPFYEGARNPSSDIMAVKATVTALHYVKRWLAQKALGRKTITITLRQYSYMPKRNSNLYAWAEFARKLDPKEYFVVIVPDTECMMHEPLTKLGEFEHFTEACWNIELRAALYESCYLNLGVNNGPFTLCWLNQKCRYLMFKVITEEAPQTTQKALEDAGFIPGQSPAFSTKYQKWVWEDDIETVIQREFFNFCLSFQSEPNEYKHYDQVLDIK
jgi:hypothetical protein